jgi:hypothetical protein
MTTRGTIYPGRAAEIEARHQGWHAWTNGPSCIGSRTSYRRTSDSRQWAMSLVCESWDQLETQLAEQDSLETTG